MDSLNHIPPEGQQCNGDRTPPGVERELARNELAGAAVADAAPLNRERRILLVEDEAFVRGVTAEVLAAAGYQLLLAASATEALQVCHANRGRVNLLLTDIVLPGANGRELARECRALYPGMRVLFISGYAEQQAACRISGESHEYLAKPFSTHMLLTKVCEVLNKVWAD